LAEVVIDALPKQNEADTLHPLRALSQLSVDQLQAIVKGCAEGLERMLKESVEVLLCAFKAYDENLRNSEALKASAATKFELPPQMKCGTIGDFHAGLEGRIGISCRGQTRVLSYTASILMQPIPSKLTKSRLFPTTQSAHVSLCHRRQ
jgi:hypothetical protein